MSDKEFFSQVCLDAGDAKFSLPWPSDQGEINYLREWMELNFRVMERAARKKARPAIHPLAAWNFVEQEVRLVEPNDPVPGGNVVKLNLAS